MAVELVRKRIRNLNLRVYPDRRVRVSVPLHVTDQVAGQFVRDKMGWIKKQQEKLSARVRSAAAEWATGDWVAYRGERYRLHLMEQNRPVGVVLGNELVLSVRPGATRENREAVLYEWYRAELKSLIPALIEKWEPILKVSVLAWGVKRMKTRWGSCNFRKNRIWLNLELMKKSPDCLEYVVVHEMVHLLEPSHNKRFYRLMDRFFPSWRRCKAQLNDGHRSD